MKDWKDKLPGYEPSEGSWFRLKNSLHLEEQLRRQLPEMPQHTPNAAAWEALEKQLQQAEGKSRRMMSWYQWAAAAAVLLFCGAWGIWQFGGNTNKQQLAQQKPLTGQVVAAEPAVQLPEEQAPVASTLTTGPETKEAYVAAAGKPKVAPSPKVTAAPAKVVAPVPLQQVEQEPEKAITQLVQEQEASPVRTLPRDTIKEQKRSRHKKIAIQWSGSEPKTVNIAFEGLTSWPEREKVATLNEPEKQLRLQLNN